jgi:hypothetical protein
VLFATLQNRARYSKFFSAELSSHLGDASGHSRVFNSGQEPVLVNRLLHLEVVGLGHSAEQVMRAAYLLEQAHSIKHL